MCQCITGSENVVATSHYHTCAELCDVQTDVLARHAVVTRFSLDHAAHGMRCLMPNTRQGSLDLTMQVKQLGFQAMVECLCSINWLATAGIPRVNRPCSPYDKTSRSSENERKPHVPEVNSNQMLR